MSSVQAHTFGRMACLMRCAAIAWLCLASTVQAQTPADIYNYSRTSSFTYRSDGLLESETVEPEPGKEALCVNTVYHYDGAGNKDLATTSNCAGASGQALFAARTSSTTYSAVAGQQIKVGGSVVAVGVPAGLFATSATNALLQSEQRRYDPRFGALISLTGPNGLTTLVEVDDFGRKTKESRADGTYSVSQYCLLIGQGLETTANSPGCGSTGSLSGIAGEIPTDAISYVHTESFDAANARIGAAMRVYSDRAGRKLRELSQAFDGGTQPGDRRFLVKDTQYNAQGVAILTTQPYFLGSGSSTTAGANDMGLTVTSYDALGRPIQVDVADPQGNVPGVNLNGFTRTWARTLISYSALTTTTVNPKGQSRTEEKNVEGRVVRITDSYGAQIAHQHDAFGNLVQTKDALQNLIATDYDIRGRKLSMNDPDTGLWQYGYNALGELVRQQSANQRAAGTVTTLDYDKLGRLTSRVEPEYTSSWSYDKNFNGSVCMAGSVAGRGAGKLCESNTSHGINKKFAYDPLGRPTSTRTTVSSGPSFATAVSYDITTGQLDKQTFPTGLTVRYAYTAGLRFLSQLQPVTTAASLPAVLWSAGTFNAWGQSETQTLGNGVSSRASFDAATGRMSATSAGIGSATNVLKHSYTWDSLGNLSARGDDNGDGNTGSVSEAFQYDSINRLTQYTVAAPQIPNLARTVTLAYNAMGNILFKSDVGNYDYAPFGNSAGVSNPRPHAVSQVVGNTVGTVAYSYDANGNMTAASAGKYRSVSYTSFNLPDSNSGASGPGGSPRYSWQYDENHQRLKETRTSTAGTRTTWSLHPDNQGGLSFESEVAPSGAVSNRHYLSAGGQTLVLVSTGALPVLATDTTTPPTLSSITLVKVEYWHKDHLGSLAATTDHNGAVTARYAYDPFGKRRMTNGRYDDFGTLIVDWTTDTNAGTDRGFTGHEHLDDIGIVHMNGRLFDPNIGRFLQADPLIQDPSNLQNYNRYGYCYNNPMGCVDPSGFCFMGCFWQPMKALNAVIRVGYDISGARFLGISYANYRIIDAVAVAFILGPQSSMALFGNTIQSAAIAGFASGAVATGSFKGAIQGAFSASMFYGVGNVVDGGNFISGGGSGNFSGPGGRVGAVVMHAVAGCVVTAAGGGKCGSGALSAAFSEAATVANLQFRGPYGVISASIIGGTASALGGGGFANGARTAAFAYLFNALAHREADRRFYSAESGVVETVGWENPKDEKQGYGFRIKIRASGDESLFVYAHVDPESTKVFEALVVMKGEYLGQYASPANGGATGPHLHFEWWSKSGTRLDPVSYLPIVMPSYVIRDTIRFRSVHPVTGKPRWHNGYDLVGSTPP